MLRLEETHLVKRTLLARAEKISGGSYPAGSVLAGALAHASRSTDELLTLVQTTLKELTCTVEDVKKSDKVARCFESNMDMLDLFL